MKKRFLFLTLGATLVTALALNALNVSMNLSANNVDRSIMLANVEALAETEYPPIQEECRKVVRAVEGDLLYLQARDCTDCHRYYVTKITDRSTCPQ